jgi:hypothetical protein
LVQVKLQLANQEKMLQKIMQRVCNSDTTENTCIEYEMGLPLQTKEDVNAFEGNLEEEACKKKLVGQNGK